MTQREPWFVRERAERQAALLWTELSVTVSSTARQESELDLKVTVERGQAPPIEFGVEVKGALGLSRILNPGQRLRPSMRRHLPQLLGYGMPIAIMVVQVRTLETYFGWLIVPAKKPSGGLVVAPDRPLHRANRQILEEAVEQLKQWIDSSASA